MSLPRFPAFSDLIFSHREYIERITSSFDPYSDFNFTSLYCWNIDDSTQVSLLNDNLVIKLPDYLTGESIYSVIGDNKMDETISELLSKLEELKLVPEATVKKIVKPEEFEINEDRNNFDYVYKLDELAGFPGSRHKKRRNKANSVSKAFDQRLEVANTNFLDDLHKSEMKVVFGEWSKSSKQTKKDLELELKAVERLLQHAHHFSLLLSTVRLDDKLVAFSINEIINQKFAICHFEKAIPVHDHLYSYLVNQAATDLLGLSCVYVNWEQDLGIHGLRKSKLSYKPDRFLKKFTVKAAFEKS